MKMMKIKFQNSSFCKLLWIRGFLERFSEEFFGGRPLITNFGLNSPPLPGKNLAVLWESLKTGRKHFPIKPVAKEIPNDVTKSCCYQKCFWAVRCKCFGNFYSLSAFARGHSTAPVSGFKTLLQIQKHFFILHSTSAAD